MEAVRNSHSVPTVQQGAARRWLKVFGTGFAIITALLLVTLFTRVPFGDLTRIARISDVQFGWRELPPPIDMAVIQQSPIDQADVLVIGDSFSIQFAWQSELVHAGYRVATTHWDWVAPVCTDFEEWIRHIGFKGKLVLIENIERMQAERLTELLGCASMAGRTYRPVPPLAASPSRPPPGFALNSGARITSGVQTWWNTRRVASSSGIVDFIVDRAQNGVFASPVADGCQQFSHPLCEKGLFLRYDREAPLLTPADAERMQAFSQRFHAFAVRWMVIPNKTSVYLDTGRARDFARHLHTLGAGPDLFTAAQEGRTQVRDLYWPNDTHWSMQGQLYFGRHMLDYVRSTIGAPAEPR